MSARTVSTDNAPRAIGPYSQGTAAAGFLFLSGQVALDPKTGALVQGTIREEEKKRRSEEHTSELQSQSNLVCRLLLEKKKSRVRRGSEALRAASPRRALTMSVADQANSR